MLKKNNNGYFPSISWTASALRACGQKIKLVQSNLYFVINDHKKAIIEDNKKTIKNSIHGHNKSDQAMLGRLI